MPHNLESLNNEELLAAYSDLITLFKERGIIRTKNIVGDIGEFLAVGYFNTTAGLPKLTAAPANTTAYDATDEAHNRYSIKSTTVNRTGAFWLDKDIPANPVGGSPFDYTLVVMLNDQYQIRRVNQLTWADFYKYKSWSSKQKAWFLSLTRKLLVQTQTIVGGNGG